jgi:hypothetical protein
MERERYIEVYKLRNTAHLKGRHNMVIGEGGVSVFPRYGDDLRVAGPPPALDAATRLGTGVPGLDALLGGGLLKRSVTIVSGSAGIGLARLAFGAGLFCRKQGFFGLSRVFGSLTGQVRCLGQSHSGFGQVGFKRGCSAARRHQGRFRPNQRGLAVSQHALGRLMAGREARIIFGGLRQNLFMVRQGCRGPARRLGSV